MKKSIILLVCICMCLSSCTHRLSDEAISNKLETVNMTQNEDSEEIMSDDITIDDSDKWDAQGILSSGYKLNNNKYYFTTKKLSSDGYNDTEMITYYDLNSGEYYDICHDPLCTHEENSGCKYAGFKELYFTKENGVFYSIYKYEQQPRICRIDLNKDTVKTVHTCDNWFTSILCQDGNILYFYEREEFTEDRETVVKKHFYRLNMENDSISDMGYWADEIGVDDNNSLMIFDNIWYYTTSDNRLMKTNLLTNEHEEIMSCGSNTLRYWFYDTDTDELYFNINNKEELSGSVYVYRNGNVEKVELPHKNIFTFALTESDIYYSTYEPIYYGVSKAPGNPEVYDYSGGKVYKTNRCDTTSSEVVYNCAGEYVICSLVTNYYVFGDGLFFDEKEIVRETIDGFDYIYFSSAKNVNKIRVDLTTGEVERICFD